MDSETTVDYTSMLVKACAVFLIGIIIYSGVIGDFSDKASTTLGVVTK
jgi:hypothetical protein